MVTSFKARVRITNHQFIVDKFKEWLLDNVGDQTQWQYYHIPDTGWAILFDNEIDAVAFKLAFGDKLK